MIEKGYVLAHDSVFWMRAQEKLRGLSRMSVSIKYAQDLCKDFEVEWNPDLIYDKPRYRELVYDDVSRVDGEDLLIHICINIGIYPDENELKFSNCFHGEGSRRSHVEYAYLGKEK